MEATGGGGEIRSACLLTRPHVLMACLLFSPFLTSSAHRRTRAGTANNDFLECHGAQIEEASPPHHSCFFRVSFSPSCFESLLLQVAEVVHLHFD